MSHQKFKAKISFARFFLFIALGLVFVCLVSIGILALTNRALPTHSQVTDRLSDLDKARLAETTHLRQALGSQVWPGWDALDVPIIVYNEAYAFLVGYPDPPAGWIRMPQNEARGGPWEVVPGDTYECQVYYRQPLPDPEVTPENFTVLVGDRWVVTMGTSAFMEISFYSGMQEQQPPFLKPVFPYRLAWGLIMGDSDAYIGSLEHEAFHAFEGSSAPDRLAEAEAANRVESSYPWDDPSLDPSWGAEMDLLIKAVRAPSDTGARELARQFLAEREKRRTALNLSSAQIDYEGQREWLEGLAKYAELTLGKVAGGMASYSPLAALKADPAFKAYKTRPQFWSEQLDEAKRTAGRAGETRFYYSGFAQAALLDRLAPGWKEKAFDPGVILEALLAEEISQP
jgi:hypothetical protein